MSYRAGVTTRALQQLPDGSLYVVHDMRMAEYCRRLLSHLGRDPACVTFVSMHDLGRLSGRSSSTVLGVDHAHYLGCSIRQLTELAFWQRRYTAPPEG